MIVILQENDINPDGGFYGIFHMDGGCMSVDKFLDAGDDVVITKLNSETKILFGDEDFLPPSKQLLDAINKIDTTFRPWEGDIDG